MTTPAFDHPGTDLPTGQVTFLCTDIEGSTRLSQQLGEAGRSVDPEEVYLTDGLAAQIG